MDYLREGDAPVAKTLAGASQIQQDRYFNESVTVFDDTVPDDTIKGTDPVLPAGTVNAT